MPQVDIDYKKIRREVEKDLNQQKRAMRAIFFATNLLIYTLFVMIAWGMYINAGGPPIEPNIPGVSQTDPIASAMLMLTISGGLGVIFQFISMMVDTKLGEAKMRERAVGRVLGEELLKLGAEEEETPREKAKRMMRLSDEGELEELTEEEMLLMTEEVEQVKQQRKG